MSLDRLESIERFIRVAGEVDIALDQAARVVRRQDDAHLVARHLDPVASFWLRDDGFRGCAFIVGAGEVGNALPPVVEGATIRVQFDETPQAALKMPGRMLKPLQSGEVVE